MRTLWSRLKVKQLDLIDSSDGPPSVAADATPAPTDTVSSEVPPSIGTLEEAKCQAGLPLMLPIEHIVEDPGNPRTEFPEAELDELAEDIRQHGILQPIAVHPADEQGRHRIHFGAKRWRAAHRAGLTEVPVVVRDTSADPYAQVAENQKRHGLTPSDLARFIRARVDAGESNATIAKRLGMDLTSVAHHLALLDLPPALEAAMHAGRCTSPRTLHELSKLHRVEPDRVQTLLAGDAEITRSAVAAVRAESSHAPKPDRDHRQRPPADVIAAAMTACERLEAALDRAAKAEPRVAESDLAALTQRVAQLATRLA